MKVPQPDRPYIFFGAKTAATFSLLNGELLCHPFSSPSRNECPLLGVKRTCRFAPQMSAYDPKRTSDPGSRRKSTGTRNMCYDCSVSLGLAKELRNAGFPNIQDLQHRQGRQFLASDGRVSVYSLGELAPPENWFIPTLEELIEACEKKEGYDHFSLEHQQLGWFASIEAQDEQTYSGSHQATAEEAVARLWLALKKQ